ncbi:hypothetical protein C8J56DRAFT_584971 [Mycena floridula]|nr:hypothetical protein C8J56DRAFT_584971 [Mycena floridula]
MSRVLRNRKVPSPPPRAARRPRTVAARVETARPQVRLAIPEPLFSPFMNVWESPRHVLHHSSLSPWETDIGVNAYSSPGTDKRLSSVSTLPLRNQTTLPSMSSKDPFEKILEREFRELLNKLGYGDNAPKLFSDLIQSLEPFEEVKIEFNESVNDVSLLADVSGPQLPVVDHVQSNGSVDEASESDTTAGPLVSPEVADTVRGKKRNKRGTNAH